MNSPGEALDVGDRIVPLGVSVPKLLVAETRTENEHVNLIAVNLSVITPTGTINMLTTLWILILFELSKYTVYFSLSHISDK